MNESATRTAHAPIEERLRAALAARAHSVGPGDLRPLRPPTTTVPPRRLVLRRALLGALALAAVAALVFLTVRGGQSRPTEPANPSRPTIGTPSPAVPSPVSPSTAEPAPITPQP
ncbi:hypothetical protein [Streptomyces sp. RPT161]|uniref:hypothetical protein n=1 Tax=Streptomyces sp. RPT161 TaxID=3015993 RepID=UPI0022B93A35|nr:hypothetical protein [Streptomyces sp. RPT161]